MTYHNLRELIDYGKSSPNREICAVILGVKLADGNFRLTDIRPVENVAGGGVADYVCNPTDFLQVLMRTKHFDPAAEVEFVGVFHNHPYWRPFPSSMDVEGAGYAGIYIIYSNIQDDILAWYNEGSDDEAVAHAMFEGRKGFGLSTIIIK